MYFDEVTWQVLGNLFDLVFTTLTNCEIFVESHLILVSLISDSFLSQFNLRWNYFIEISTNLIQTDEIILNILDLQNPH